jgi:tetratricopeptide (TPR) repeat protein
LAHLLRLEERPDADRADLFSGWRLFFERMAATEPVILAFEDLQWADSGLLEFVDYLLEWSAEHPIFVLALGRPELRRRRPAWTQVNLEPLAADSVEEILQALAPGLPPELMREIGRRAEGIPLYVVETIRMLLDRRLLVQEGARYVITGDVSDLDVPETLQALVASRLDGLSAGERSLLQDASVLGQSFAASAAAVLSGRAEPEVVGLLNGLVDKQILGRDDDPRSPERGQYQFLQALLRTVAYGTLSRRVRKARHVAAAEHLGRTWPGESRDIAEVLASHYLEAIRADPEAGDVTQLRAFARQTLTEAGRAATSLLLGPEAQRYFEQAAELAEDDRQRADLFELAGQALRDSGDTESAEVWLRQAVELRRSSGTHPGGRAATVLASILRFGGRLDEARDLLDRFRDADQSETDPIVRAEALGELASVQVAAGDLEDGARLIEEALGVLEEEQAWASLTPALISRAVYLILSHRYQEGQGVLRHALTMAERHDLPQVALRARFNLAAISIEAGQLTEAVDELDAGLRLARERGDRYFERLLLSQCVAPLVTLGRWDQASALSDVLFGDVNLEALGAPYFALVSAARGDDEMLARCVALAGRTRDSESVDIRGGAALVLARAALERSDLDEVQRVIDEFLTWPALPAEYIDEAYAISVQAAILSGDAGLMARRAKAMAAIRPAQRHRLVRATSARLEAQAAHQAGDPDRARRAEVQAEALLREVGARPRLAQAQLERARRRDDQEALNEARAIYSSLDASRWLERVDQEFGVTA